MDEQLLPDLLQLRGSVVAASDEFFAAKENLTKAAAPVFVPDTYDAKGQVYDGWETRRRRGPGGKLPDRSARDWVIVRLGMPGVVRAIVVDTAFFTGNFPQACAADACSVTGYPAFEEIAADSEAVTWQEIVPRGLVTGDARHAFKVSSGRRYTHVRLNIFPDGGVARLRVHGEVVPDPAMLEGLTVDLAALENGADVAAGSDRNDFSAPRNVISPGLSRVIGEAGRPAGAASPGTSGWSSGWPGTASSTSRRSTPPGTGATSRRARRCRRWTPLPAPPSPTSPPGANCCRRSACCRIRRTGSA